MAASSCGPDLIVERWEGDRNIIARIDRSGRTLTRITNGPEDQQPVCSSDGATVYYLDTHARWTVKRCDGMTCRELFSAAALNLALSPDNKRLAFIESLDRGAMIRWATAEGGQVRDVAEAETLCTPVWSGPRTLWISRKRGGKASWVEVDTDTQQETGRVLPGASDCSSGIDDEVDPSSPARGDVKVDIEQISQVRLLPAGYWPVR
jgi:hypothetical protein